MEDLVFVSPLLPNEHSLRLAPCFSSSWCCPSVCVGMRIQCSCLALPPPLAFSASMQHHVSRIKQSSKFRAVLPQFNPKETVNTGYREIQRLSRVRSDPENGLHLVPSQFREADEFEHALFPFLVSSCPKRESLDPIPLRPL